MFDTMTTTKVVGGLCGTFLVLLLGKWAAEEIYHVGAVAHGDEEVAQAYSIDVPESGAGGEEEAGPSFEEVFASADAAAGERVFGKCRACHKLDGANATGPHLDGVVNREIAAVGDYAYSEALTSLEGAWDPAALDGFLHDPRGYAPGTKMSFSGLPSVEDRVNLIAYLESAGG